MSLHLDSTFGAALLGMVVAAILYGVAVVQFFYYFTHQNDTWPVKLLVFAVMISDSVHQACITHGMYTYTITYWGQPAKLDALVWSLTVEVLFTGITAFLVQSFLTLRIWRLSKGNIYLTGSSAILVVGCIVNVIISQVQAYHLKTVADLLKLKNEDIAVNVIGAATDLLIAASLCILLHLSRTGFNKSDAIIDKLIVYSVNTGLLTSICATASVISLLAAANTFIYIAFFFCLSPLYTNSLLATLNVRKILGATHNEPTSGNGLSVALSDFPNTSSSATQRQTISIKIDNATQEYPSVDYGHKMSP